MRGDVHREGGCARRGVYAGGCAKGVSQHALRQTPL